MVKSFKKVGIIFIVFLLLLVVGLFATKTFSITGGCEEVLAMPQYARFQCEIDQTKPTTFSGRSYLDDTGYWLADPRSRGWIQCGDQENTNYCEVRVHPREGCAGKTLASYRRCSSRFPENCGDWVTGVRIPSDPTTIYADLPAGYFLEIELHKCPGYTGKDFVTEWYHPYVLMHYEGAFKQEISKEGCSLFDMYGEWSSKINRIGIPTSCTPGMEGCTKQDQISSTLQPGHWINYIKGWTYGPTDLNTHEKGGKLYYCNGLEVYDLQRIDIKDGGCYQTLKSKVASIGSVGWECCPGMILGNKKCDVDWKWKDIGVGEDKCFTDAQCQAGSQFKGGWSIDYSDPTQTTIIRGKCVDGFCDYRKESRQVECTSSAQCKGGAICSNFVCIKGEPRITIDEVISEMFSLDGWLLYIILIPFGALLFYARKRDWVWAVIGAFIGLFLAFILQIIWESWLSLLFGGILAGFALILIPGLGLAILTFLTLITKIFEVIGGK